MVGWSTYYEPETEIQSYWPEYTTENSQPDEYQSIKKVWTDVDDAGLEHYLAVERCKEPPSPILSCLPSLKATDDVIEREYDDLCLLIAHAIVMLEHLCTESMKNRAHNLAHYMPRLERAVKQLKRMHRVVDRQKNMDKGGPQLVLI